MKRKSLDIVRHLYEEEANEPLDDLIERDVALHDEYVALREAKALMDARPRRKPAASTLEAVIDAASHRSVARLDRAPMPSTARRNPALRLAGWVRPAGYAVAACLLVLSGYWIGLQSDGPSLRSSVASESMSDETSLAPSENGRSVPGLRKSVLAEQAVQMASPEENVLLWDDTDDLLMIQWRVGSLEENLSGTTWDRAVPLNGMMSDETSFSTESAGDSMFRWIYR